MPDLIDRLRAAGVPSGYTADAHPARSILSALAADKRAILRCLLEERLGEMTPDDWQSLADAARNRSYWGVKLRGDRRVLALLAPEDG